MKASPHWLDPTSMYEVECLIGGNTRVGYRKYIKGGEYRVSLPWRPAEQTQFPFDASFNTIIPEFYV